MAVNEEDKELEQIKAKKLRELMEKIRRKEKEEPMTNKPIILTDKNFDEKINKYPLMVIDFWAPWCMPCLAMAPVFEELAKEYAGRVVFGKLNVDENPLTASAYGIMGIPTLVVMKNGKEVDRIVGLVPKEHIKKIVDKHLP